MKSEVGSEMGSQPAGLLGAPPPGHAEQKPDLSKPRSSRYETLTAWRGIACLFVVIFHSVCTGYGLGFPNGPRRLSGLFAVVQRLWIGVPLFFVISGYCVTASADAARARPNPGPRFFWRRFRRIYPPYWAWLAVAALCIGLVEHFSQGFFERVYIPDPRAFTPWQWLGNLTLTESWRWHLTGGVESELLSPSWTLCYEEQFYALVGLALILARRYFFIALTLLTLGVITGMFLLPEIGVSTRGLFLDGKWLMFAAGVLVYYVGNYAPRRFRVWFCIPLGFGVLCAFAAPAHLLERRINEPNLSYFCAFLFALLLMALHDWDAHLAGSRWLRPLTFCGEMCYSLYLVHWPIVIMVGWGFGQLGFHNEFLIFFPGLACCLGVAIVLARLFHHFIERRFWNPGYSGNPAGAARP